MDNNNYALFADRTRSIVERWAKYVTQHPKRDQSEAVRAAMHEINDSYTAHLARTVVERRDAEIERILKQYLQAEADGDIEKAARLGRQIDELQYEQDEANKRS